VENAYKFDFPIHTPFHELTQEQKRLLWRGNEYFHGLDDFFAYIDSERRKIQFRVMKARYTGKTTCPECGGSRLRREALYVKVGGKTVADLVVMPVDELIAFFAGLELDGHDTKVSDELLDNLSKAIEDGLKTVSGEENTVKSISLAKLKEMKAKLVSGYTSFWS
jgi:excinuclease ABC subunit A